MRAREPYPHLLIARKEFLDRFKDSIPGISEYDVRETMTQVVEVLSNRGREELFMQDALVFPDLNRMVDQRVRHDGALQAAWRAAAKQLTHDFIQYLEHNQLFDENRWFHYLLINVTPTVIVFEYFPF